MCLCLSLCPGDIRPLAYQLLRVIRSPTCSATLLLAERHNDHIIFLPASRYNMEAIAKFDFTASGEDELSFHTGDILKVGDLGPRGYMGSLGCSAHQVNPTIHAFVS